MEIALKKNQKTVAGIGMLESVNEITSDLTLFQKRLNHCAVFGRGCLDSIEQETLRRCGCSALCVIFRAMQIRPSRACRG